MGDDEKFHQRWEFRRKEVDGDTSSDDNRSNSNGVPKRRNLVADLVLLNNDEASDNPEPQTLDKQAVEADVKKIKSSNKKKKNAVQKKTKKKKINVQKNEEMVMLKDLKVFANSLIQELTVSRESMFAHMRDEMRKLVARGLKNGPIVKKNVRRPQKNKASRQKGVEAGAKPKNVKSNVVSDGRKLPRAVKNDQVLEMNSKNELTKADDGLRVSSTAHTNLANGSNQVVSSSYMTLPTIIPNQQQFQNPRNYLPLNDHIHIGKLIDEKKLYQERFGSFSYIPHKSIGLLGQNCSQMASVAFPVPLSQGTDNGSNISSLTHCENSFMDNNKVGLTMSSVVRFPRGNQASPDQMFTYNMARKSDGEFMSMRPQELKDGQFYMTSLRNQQ